MTDSTNPRVMADNIRELSGVSASQTSEISSLQTAADALGSYSTTEVDTGKKYNGLTVYRKTFVFESPLSLGSNSWNSSGISLAEDPTGYTIIEGVGIGTLGETLPVNFKPIFSAEDPTIGIFNIRGTGIGIKQFWLEYTKPVPSSLNSPAPDDTRFIEPEEIREEIPEEITEENVK